MNNQYSNPNPYPNPDNNFLYIIFIHTKKKKIQCRYESPREKAREEHG
jgi:hypothetical protein